MKICAALTQHTDQCSFLSKPANPDGTKSLPSQCLGTIETWHSVQTKERLSRQTGGEGGGKQKGVAGIVFAPITINISHPHERSS